MNNQRRERISKIVSALQELQSQIEDITSEEQDAFYNMPEGLQSSERGDKAQEAISNLESASLENVINYLESAME